MYEKKRQERDRNVETAVRKHKVHFYGEAWKCCFSTTSAPIANHSPLSLHNFAGILVECFLSLLHYSQGVFLHLCSYGFSSIFPSTENLFSFSEAIATTTTTRRREFAPEQTQTCTQSSRRRMKWNERKVSLAKVVVSFMMIWHWRLLRRGFKFP